MKNILTVLAILATSVGFSQQRVIKVDIIAPAFKTLVLAYEKVASEDASFQAGFAFTGDGDNGRRLAFTGEYRYYLSDEKPAPAGFYVAPFAQYINITEKINSVEHKAGAIGLGVVAGYQWLFKERVTFGGFLGPDYMIPTREQDPNSSLVIGITKGFTLRAGVTLGLAF